MEIRLERGDITQVAVDAIVNAANERLLGGGGVDGAIHRAAGPQLLESCRAIPELRPGVRCPTGEARVTPAFDLPARLVIHTVGPVYRSAEQSGPLLRAAYRSSLELAVLQGVCSIAFPAISCGIYGYPLGEAAPLALETCVAHGQALDEIRFVLFSAEVFAAWASASAT